MIPTLSACFTGPRTSKMPYDEKSVQHEKLEKILKTEILKLIRIGVSEFYCGGQTGIDTLAALLVLQIRDEIGTTARLHLALPYKDIYVGFTLMQKDNLRWILKNADTVTYINEKYTSDCYKEQNRYMVERSDYLIAVAEAERPHSGTYMTINMARKKGIEIILIDLLTFKISRKQRQ